MHIDLNSCFATIEQQANPKLRGRPVVVAAYPTGGGCILTASVEAKNLGIKTGMRVRQAEEICRDVIVLTPDPAKYRHVHKEMMKIFESYCGNVTPKSIDEAVLVFNESLQTPGVDGLDSGSLICTGQKIKQEIKEKIGEWLTVSIGLAPNRFLAKTAAGLKKPDGLEEINHVNLETVLAGLTVRDLCGINFAWEKRLNTTGIFSGRDFLRADILTLRSVFRSILARHWYLRLRGFEVDDYSTEQKSLGHSYALPTPTNDLSTLRPILYRLCEKVGRRLRLGGLEARGIYVGGVSRKLPQPIFTTENIFFSGLELLRRGLDPLGSKPNRLITVLAVGVFNLSPSLYQQQSLFEDQIKKKNLTQAMDKINNKFGEFSVTTGNVLGMDKKILDRVAFGGIRDI